MDFSQKKFFIIYSERHDSYDLFRDLREYPNVDLIVPRMKSVKNNFIKFLRKIHLSKEIANHVKLPLKRIWYEPITIHSDSNHKNFIVVVDMALAELSAASFNNLRNDKTSKKILLFLNSSNSDVFKRIKNDINKIGWDKIYTFDAKDAEKFGYEDAGYCYYSKHSVDSLNIFIPDVRTDIYYVGALSESRNKTIFDTYSKLKTNYVKSEFHLMVPLKNKYDHFPYDNEIDYFTTDKGLIPYDEILGAVLQTNTILEIVQKGQSGPTLRYFEAVCYNKKLLSNNPYVVNFPFYNEKFMKIFRTPEDIDIEWLKEDIRIDYHYNNEFSPLHLLEKVKEI